MVMTSVAPRRHPVLLSEPAEPEVTERATRRVFSAQYKLKILAEYERRDVTAKGPSCAARGCTHRRSLNGASSAMMAHCRH